MFTDTTEPVTAQAPTPSTTSTPSISSIPSTTTASTPPVLLPNYIKGGFLDTAVYDSTTLKAFYKHLDAIYCFMLLREEQKGGDI